MGNALDLGESPGPVPLRRGGHALPLPSQGPPNLFSILPLPPSLRVRLPQSQTSALQVARQLTEGHVQLSQHDTRANERAPHSLSSSVDTLHNPQVLLHFLGCRPI